MNEIDTAAIARWPFVPSLIYNLPVACERSAHRAISYASRRSPGEDLVLSVSADCAFVGFICERDRRRRAGADDFAGERTKARAGEANFAIGNFGLGKREDEKEYCDYAAIRGQV